MSARPLVPMAERYQRPAWVRRINAMADAVGGARRVVPLDASLLLELAEKSVGGAPAGDFGDPHWPMVAQLTGVGLDMAEMYRFHRRILQVMQHGAPRRSWLLKTPGHLMTLDLLHGTYPDAWIVQTHRDPARTMPSTVSTTAMVQWLRSDRVDLASLAVAIGAGFAFALNNVAEQRRQGTSPLRFVDVHFQQLLKDPVGTLRRTYAAMGRDFGAEHAERIRRYLAEKPQGKFGKHRYSPEEWGFSARELHERLAPYIAYFGVELE